MAGTCCSTGSCTRVTKKEPIRAKIAITPARMKAERVPVAVASAVVRASYHLYQGFGPFIGNVLMGLLFGWFYTRTRRVMPLVIAHFLLDAVAFLAFPLVLQLFGLNAL